MIINFSTFRWNSEVMPLLFYKFLSNAKNLIKNNILLAFIQEKILITIQIIYNIIMNKISDDMKINFNYQISLNYSPI